ncbi:MAG TPA: peptidyl-alpha-hydroxyglycine alpha-amidating lyase family protein [Vicinamibacterales bacterium]
MSRQGRHTIAAFGILFGVSVWTVQPLAQAPATPPAAPQSTVAPTNDAPNPYETVEGYFKMPDGRTWGSTSAVDIDRDGKSIWVAERCGANNCWVDGKMSTLDVVLKFDPSGKLVRSFGAGMFVFPHGIHVDRDGNVWVTDGQDNLPRRGRGAAADAPLPPPPATIVGHQVIKFSPEGKVLLTLGKAGGNRPGEPADPSSFYQPNDVITNAAGEIFVAEGHSSGAGSHARISKFDKSGKFIKEWGKRGTGPGEMDQPHALAWDSKGRLFVADRGNNRIQIFDQEGKLLEYGWEQYSRISGLWIDPKDMLYAADSESGSVAPARKDWKRGIRIGSVRDGKDGKVQFFIPDPSTATSGTLAAEGVAVDGAGNVYGAEVGPRALKKYVKK